MTSLPEENTLGAIVGAKSQRREADATRRVIRTATPRRSSLGTGFIGIGAAVVVALRAIYGFVWFVSLWPTYPDPMPAPGLGAGAEHRRDRPHAPDVNPRTGRPAPHERNPR